MLAGLLSLRSFPFRNRKNDGDSLLGTRTTVQNGPGYGTVRVQVRILFRSHLHSFLCRILSRAWVPCEAWRPMTTPTTRPAAGRGAGRAKVGAVCRGAAGAACGAEGAVFVVEARSGFLFLHNSVLTQDPFTRSHLIPDTV